MYQSTVRNEIGQILAVPGASFTNRKIIAKPPQSLEHAYVITLNQNIGVLLFIHVLPRTVIWNYCMGKKNTSHINNGCNYLSMP